MAAEESGFDVVVDVSETLIQPDSKKKTAPGKDIWNDGVSVDEDEYAMNMKKHNAFLTHPLFMVRMTDAPRRMLHIVLYRWLSSQS